MDNDPIKCFQHCDNDVNILCLETLPPVCPVCGRDVYSTPSKIPPFRLPSPFVDSTDTPYSVVVKPTSADFLSTYQDGEDLHIGVTDSRGVVYDFNQTGVNRRDDGWTQCLAAPIIREQQYEVSSVWDTKLMECSAYDKWLPQSYSESTHNCYTFVLSFLDLLQKYSPTLSLPCTLSRADFSRTVVLPLTVQAAKYITLYRSVLRADNQVSVQYITAL